MSSLFNLVQIYYPSSMKSNFAHFDALKKHTKPKATL